jgi:hypothetical protein
MLVSVRTFDRLLFMYVRARSMLLTKAAVVIVKATTLPVTTRPSASWSSYDVALSCIGMNRRAFRLEEIRTTAVFSCTVRRGLLRTSAQGYH